MWSSIAYVSSGITLVAFIVATVARVLKIKLKQRERLITLAPEDERATLVESALEFLKIDTTNLTKEQQYNLALEQIRAKSEKFRIISVVIIFIAILAAGVAVFAITNMNSTSDSNDNTFEILRARALIAGYEGAFALAYSIEGQDNSKEVATINAQIKKLGISNLTYPNNPVGENGDGKPALAFAQKMIGELSAIDNRVQIAFEVGFFGVISINTPKMKPSGFDLMTFALKAGFKGNQNISENAYLESLIKKARSIIKK